MYAEAVRWPLGADGRVPRFAQRLVMPGSKENDSLDHFLVFSPLADPRFVLSPQLYGRAPRAVLRERRADCCHQGGEVFSKAGMASASRAWWRGRAVSVR